MSSPSSRWAAAALASAVSFFWFSSSGGCGSSGPAKGTGTLRPITTIEETIGGVEAGGRVGDFLFDNGRVRFTVQAPGSATGWGIYGGSVVDLDRSVPSPDPRTGDDRLQEMFFECDLRGFLPESATVINDGADGQPAVLRLTGVDRGIPLIDALLSTKSLGLAITLDYILAKDSDTLEVSASIRDTQKTEDRDLSCGFVLLHGDSLDLFLPGKGFGLEGSDIDYVAAAATDARSSYVLSRAGGPLAVLLAIDEVLPLATDRKPFLANGKFEERFFLSVGKGDVESALAEMRRVKQADTTALKPVSVALSAPAELSAYLPQTRVDFFDTGKNVGADAVTSARIIEGGAATAALPVGRYRAEVWSEGRKVDELTLEVGAAGGPSDLRSALSGSGFLHVKSSRADKAGTVVGPTAAKLTVLAGHGAALGAAQVYARYLLPDDKVLLPAGDYTAVLSRGPEYEIDVHDVTVTALGTTELEGKLKHVIDSTGWITLDSHLHSTKSVDANAALEQRVLGAIGEGLDILLSTDHDIVIDYGPTAARLGVSDQIKTETGIEISPMYGHMNAFPMPTEGESYWHVPWFEYAEDHSYKRMIDPHEITALARKKGAQVVQVNHPRQGKGIFDYIEFNPDDGSSKRPWPAADAFEILNGKSGNGGGDLDTNLRDLIGMIKANKRMTATGVSDAHGRGSEPGYCRTAVKSAIDEPKDIDLLAVWKNLRDGHAVATNGPWIRFNASSGSARGDIGDVIASGGQPVRFEVEVDAPSWLKVSRLRVLADGVPVIDRPITAADASPSDPTVRIRATLTATPTKDAFYLVVATGDESSPPVLDTRSVSVSNPIFIDADGAGFSYRH